MTISEMKTELFHRAEELAAFKHKLKVKKSVYKQLEKMNVLADSDQDSRKSDEKSPRRTRS